MLNKILPIADYKITSSDVFFFDNNIWMYVACPLGKYKYNKQRVYSNFYSYVLERRNPIYINSLVLSEFSNRYLRLDFNLENKYTLKFPDFKKDYVGSEKFKETVALINNEIKKIFSKCEKCSDELNSINFNEVIDLFKQIGFNDSYYAFLAAKKKWIIVTDDSDFSSGKIPDLGLTILTMKI